MKTKPGLSGILLALLDLSPPARVAVGQWHGSSANWNTAAIWTNTAVLVTAEDGPPCFENNNRP